MARVLVSLFVLALLAVMCYFLVLQPMMAQDIADTTNGEYVNMVQPDLNNPDTAYQYSQTNKNNSEANRNNAEARYLDETGPAEAELDRARACDIRNDCNSGASAKETLLALWSGAGLVIILGVGLVFLAIVLKFLKVI